MEEKIVDEIIKKVIENMNFEKFPITVNVSNRHCHLSEKDLEILFGSGYKLTSIRNLMQPGQFAAQETVTLVGPKGKIENVRIIGPTRKQTQVEISRTDSFVLGVKPPVRESGDLVGSSAITIVGPKGKVDLKEGCIIALRHLHLTPQDAEKLGVKDKDMVKILCGINKGRETIFSDVICRVSSNYATECHLDTDEANAAMVDNGEKVFIVGRK
jgi:putative phosphotransacetylase